MDAAAMRILRVVLPVCLALSACRLSPAKPCNSDAQCPGGYCDTSLGVCATQAGSCPAGCSDWQACTGTFCDDRYQSLGLTSPDAGAIVGKAVTVTAALSLWPGM